MKKLFAVLLALTLVLSMGTMALAADTGTITIENAADGATYEIYKMLDFVPSNATGDKGIYTIVNGWADFFAAEPATNYFTVTTANGQTTVAAKDGITAVDQTLAKAAIEYAETKSIAATKTATANGSAVEFTALDLGYYAIDTSLGTLCALTNTNSEFTATEKNEKPEIDKVVQEDADNSWGKVNDADIDQTVNYKATVTVAEGAVNYVMHDKMSEGLTFGGEVTVKIGETEVAESNYTLKTTGITDGCTFEIEFKNEYIAALDAGTKLDVYYSATLNENAAVAVAGNSNEVVLKYGDNNEFETSKKETKTYTWKMDVLKYTMDGENKVNLAGAKFQLLDADGKAIKFTEVAGAAVPTYKVDAEGTVDTIITDANGKFEFVGLDEGAYKLHETEAPEGYNKLAKDVDVVITSTHNDTDLTASYEINGKAPATIEVENKTGGLLPETGGIGTTVFYIVGITLMLGAAIILISKKRMASFA